MIKKYIGNKNIAGVYQKIINNIPYHENYFELFAGSGAIANKLFDNGWSGTNMFINDINSGTTANFAYPINSIISNVNALQLLKSPPAGTANRFYFLDPPYLFSTRANSKLYEFEMTDADHIQLLAAVKLSSDKIMIIHPKCDLYNSMLCNFRKVELKIRYHNKTSIEVLYMNYPVVKYPMVTAFLGEDCWKRQRIKRNSDYNNAAAAGTAKLF